MERIVIVELVVVVFYGIYINRTGLCRLFFLKTRFEVSTNAIML